jgi:PST family polysaccharide transporter
MASNVYQTEVPAVPLDCFSEVPRAAKSEKASYTQILKSSVLIGSAQVFNIAIGIVRTKVMAILLGPAGFGLAGLYNSVVDLTQNIAGLGVNSSGVRQIAEAVGSDDTNRIALTIAVVRRTSVVLGALGALALIAFCRQISIATFGTGNYSAGVAVMSIAAFCKLVSGGQGALIQGMRRIGDLAKMNVLGAVFGAVIGVALIYHFREKGIVPYVVVIALMGMLTSWWYSRKIDIERLPVSFEQVREEATALLRLGFAFMISSMMTLGVAFGVRVTLLHKLGLQATGCYQSAWTLGGLYVGFILQAMAADFYPRLTGSINDHETCNRLVNEQARVGLLLAGPGVIATLTFAPVVIAALYSTKFGGSVPILRWICLGTTLQVITWPMGFIIVAKGKQNLFIFSEVAWAVVSIALAWISIVHVGVTGAGIAFFGSYIFHGCLVYPIARHLSGFRWSRDNLCVGLVYTSVIAAVFCGFYWLPLSAAVSFGTIAALGSGIYSMWAFSRLVSFDEIPRPLRRIIMRIKTSVADRSSTAS